MDPKRPTASEWNSVAINDLKREMEGMRLETGVPEMKIVPTDWSAAFGALACRTIAAHVALSANQTRDALAYLAMATEVINQAYHTTMTVEIANGQGKRQAD